jgi:hypothetical protein
VKFRSVIAIFAALVATSFAMEQPSSHTKGTPTGKPTGPLKPGEYWWKPDLSPRGPVVALVSLPQQTMYVYRNGILIGRSSVSSGRKGNSTPPGVFNILEKKQTHYSKKYNNAPMPNMQRLTWTGIAMHSGQLPGYAASHGCIRLPYDFSTLLFAATSKGGTVVIGDGKTPQPYLASNPGLMLAPKDFTPAMLHPLAANEYDWRPERSSSGPITIVISSADKALYVYRNGNPIIQSAALRLRSRAAGLANTCLPCSKARPANRVSSPPDGKPAAGCEWTAKVAALMRKHLRRACGSVRSSRRRWPMKLHREQP